MFGFGKKPKSVNKKIIEKSGNLENYTLSKSLETNIDAMKKIFTDDDTLRIRYFKNQFDNSIECCIVYIDGMINNEIINKNVIDPIQTFQIQKQSKDILEVFKNQVLNINGIEKTSDFTKIVENMVYGDTIFFTQGACSALILDTKGWLKRSIAEPEAEKVISGPREGFTESVLVNLSLVRRKVRTQNLKMKFRTVGSRTKTKACICYIEGLVNKDVLDELYRRLDSFDLETALDSNYLCEYISDAKLSLFKTVGNTERPDTVIGKIMEGRVAVFLDGTPVVLTIPYLFIEYFQTSEDYYINFYASSISRVLRIISFILTISVTAIYLSIISFHQEILPSPLLLSITQARQGVPFPTLIEAIIMLSIFDLLRETGIRNPSSIGNALSIVGALVIGQSAVDAKLISAPMVIVIALTGMTGLMVPKFRGTDTILRIILLFACAIAGLYGYIFVIAAVLIHLFNLRSFGVPIMTEIFTFKTQKIKDTFMRVPWWKMLTRPKFISNNNHEIYVDKENPQ